MATHIIEKELPLKILSESNRRDHWRVSSKRKAAHRSTARAMLQQHLRPLGYAGRFTITLTRLSPRKLDDDNLASGFKAVRDGVADWLGIDDGSDRLTWRYAQQAARHYAALVTIEWEIEHE